MNKVIATLKPLHHRGAERIGIYFGYREDIKEAVKELGARYSRTHRCWYVDRGAEQLHRVFKRLVSFGRVDYEALKAGRKAEPGAQSGKKGQAALAKAPLPRGAERKLALGAYSANTQNTYRSCLQHFFGYCRTTEVLPEELNLEDLEEFMLWWIGRTGAGNSYRNQMVNALKFYYERVLGRPRILLKLPRARKSKALPKALSEKEILALLEAMDNLKQRCLAVVMYSSGLRVSEAIRLRVNDVDMERGEIRVNQGKGEKDRYTILAGQAKPDLTQYLAQYKPRYWLFEGQIKGHYSAGSVRSFIAEAAKKAALGKKVTPHMLRHSFATHLLDQGASLRHVQELLGHGSVKTTEIYTYISTRSLRNITSPLDRIIESNQLNDREKGEGGEKGNKINM